MPSCFATWPRSGRTSRYLGRLTNCDGPVQPPSLPSSGNVWTPRPAACSRARARLFSALRPNPCGPLIHCCENRALPVGSPIAPALRRTRSFGAHRDRMRGSNMAGNRGCLFGLRPLRRRIALATGALFCALLVPALMAQGESAIDIYKRLVGYQASADPLIGVWYGVQCDKEIVI